MGRDKGRLDFGGVPLIVHTARLIEPLVACVTVIGPPRRYAAMGLRAIVDRDIASQGSKEIRLGPLAGIATALAATHVPWNLILACDLPYLSAEWIDWLLSRALRSHGQVVIPRTGRGLEPLAAIYRSECCGPIAAALARGARKVSDVVEELRMDIVDQHEWRRLDPCALILKNMNTRGDYDEARKWRGAQDIEAADSTKDRISSISRTRKARVPSV